MRAGRSGLKLIRVDESALMTLSGVFICNFENVFLVLLLLALSR